MIKLLNLIKNNKVNFIIGLAIVIVTVIAVIVAIINNKKKSVETSAIQEIQEVEETKIADVLDSNIQFDYNKEPTEEAIELNIKKYDNSYNLYYCIKEVGQEVAEKTEETAQEIAEEVPEDEYVLYNGEPISIETNSVLSFKYEKDGVYSKNAYNLQITNIINKGEIKEGATEEELEKGKVDEEEKAKGVQPYYIKINYTANCVTIYKKDDSGNYTVPVKAMVCSTGTATPTKGVYKTLNKYVWKELNGHCWGQYSTRIVGHILFHSVPYSSPRHDDLRYNLYDKLGTRASAGCIRLTVADAKWIYDNCALGTMVEFYSSSNPGPLGKPGAMKISGVAECRNWDPTDPVAGNPWRTWNGKTTTTTVQQPEQQQTVQKPEPTNTKTENNNDNKSQIPSQSDTTNSNTDNNTDENEISDSDKDDNTIKKDEDSSKENDIENTHINDSTGEE